MNAVRHEDAPREVPFQAGLLKWLDTHDVRYEIIDGLLVVTPQPRPGMAGTR